MITADVSTLPVVTVFTGLTGRGTLEDVDLVADDGRPGNAGSSGRPVQRDLSDTDRRRGEGRLGGHRIVGDVVLLDSPIVEWLFDGSNAANFNVIGEATVIGPV